jgi:hypothetical protein
MKKIIIGFLFVFLFLLPGLFVNAETLYKTLQADASIKANLSGLRAQAELFYDNVYIANGSVGYYGGSYKNMCKNSTIKEILNKIKKDSGKTPKCNSTKDNYVISSPLKSDPSIQYCVDSTGFSGSGVAVSKNNTNACEKQLETTTNVNLDSKSQKTENFVMSSSPTVKIISPNKGKTYHVGDKLKIKWQADNVPKNTGVFFQLQGKIKGVDNSFGIELPSMGFSYGSQDFSNMIDAKKGKGSFSWVIPNIYDFPGYDKNVYRVQAILRGENLMPNQNNNWKEVIGFSEEFYIKK